MSSLFQHPLAPPPEHATMGIAKRGLCAGVLAITADIRFYSNVLNAASSFHWRTEWARTMEGAIRICNRGPMPIVIYDGYLPGVEWSHAFDLLSIVSNHPRILLVAPLIDEDLWLKVLRHHGYDTVERSASAEEWSRALRFAWLSLHVPPRD